MSAAHAQCATLRGGCNAKRCNATCRPRWITLSNKLALSLAVYIYKYIHLLLLNNLYIQKLKYKVKLYNNNYQVGHHQSKPQVRKSRELFWFDARGTPLTHSQTHTNPHTHSLTHSFCFHAC